METSADLDNLLLWLGQGTSIRPEQYVEVRKKLITLFEFRGCEDPQELADETLDRAARAILKPEFRFQGNPIAYLRGVARNVYLESQRKVRGISQELLPELTDAASKMSSNGHQIESLYACLEHCLGKLTADKRFLLLQYYEGEKSAKIDRRMQLARQQGIALNTLRIQVFRLRKAIGRCVESCAKTKEIDLRF